MEKQFYILLSLRTSKGFELCGQYVLGNNSKAAFRLFDELQGDEHLIDAGCLHLDLLEASGEFPEKIKTKCCRLDQYAANSKLIVREIFRQKNLEVSE